MAAERCRGCGGRFADAHDDASHAYMLASAGCWTTYTAVLAREYQEPALFARFHRLTVDAYAVQHRGVASDPRAARSVQLHFLSLDAIFRRGLSHDTARRLLGEAARRAFLPLPEATPAFPLTLADVVSAGPAAHTDAVQAWARSAHAAWLPLLAG